MKYPLVVVLIVIVVSACSVGVPYSGELPEYVVMLTSAYPTTTYRCTGVAISKNRVLTMEHCSRDRRILRIVTQRAQETGFRVISTTIKSDLALLEPTNELRLSEYARFANPSSGRMGTAFGVCPNYLLNAGRTVQYRRPFQTYIGGRTYQTDEWRVLDSSVCGGDSGGIIIQEKNVVGVIHAIRSPFWIHVGKAVYTINGTTIRHWLWRIDGRHRGGYSYLPE